MSVMRSTSRSSHSPQVTVMGVLMLRIVDVEEDEVAAEVLAPDE